MLKLEEFVSQVARDADEYIATHVTGYPRELYEASLHIIKVGGKRLRPALLVASGMLFDKQYYPDLIPYAASVELMHTFTLIHDDIMDNDDFRRGVPTVHRLWGVPMAILAGDVLFAKAIEIASEYAIKSGRVSEDRAIRAIFELSKATRIVAEGQALDMSFEKRDDVSEKEYLDMIYKKTSALIEASAKIGAIVAGADENSVDAIGRYAVNLGIAFQIKDDILGVFGREEEIGKPVYSDLRERKKTILVILALRKGSEELKERLLKVLGNRSAEKDEFKAVAEMIDEEGIRQEAELEALKFVDEALKSLHELKGKANEDFLELLRQLAVYVVSREK
uniref:Polyprenyl synthetase family protein n=1 Tax=Fervidicoccus fontis TaxID=683846 RepID=A0A7J3ZLL1_9CREN